MAQAAGAGDYFLHAQSDRERRVLIGHFAGLIRSMDTSTKGSQIASDLFTALVAEKSRIGSISWRARASCDLGYTGLAMGRPDAEQLFQEGIATAKSHQARTFPLDPPPSGACAYWLKLAGDEARARRVADQHIEGWRAAVAMPGSTHRANTGALLGLAISYAEAENGELMVDWPRRVWDQ